MKSKTVDIILISLLGLATGYFGGKYFTDTKIPDNVKVQQGYIAPSELEVKCEDLDRNGEPETYLKVGDVTYALREVNGLPVLFRYDVKPSEIIIRE